MRRYALPVILVVAAVLSAVGARLVDEAGKPDEIDGRSAPLDAATTPLLSARRVPTLISEPSAEAALAERLGEFADTLPERSCVSVRRGDRAIFDRRPELPLVPASTQKLVTGLTALEVLGAETSFTTRAVAASQIDGGNVDGDLWLVGGGDPVLVTDPYRSSYEEPPIDSDLEALADELVESGLTTVSGSVLGDETRYDSRRYLSVWPERFIEQHQTGPLGALTVDDAFTDYPSDDFNRALATPAVDPAAHAASVFDDLLEDRGVTVSGAPDNAPAEGDVELAAIESPRVADIVVDMVDASDNATAELLLKEIGYASGDGNQPGSTDAGLVAMRQVLSASDLPIEGVTVTDGSGLSPENRLTCVFLVELLESQPSSSPLIEGLSVAGESGTLRERFVGTDIEGRLRAKTGTLNDVTALAGVLETTSGDELTFSFIVNRPDLTLEALAFQNTLVETLASFRSEVDLEALDPA